MFEAGGVIHAVRVVLDISDDMAIDEVQLASAFDAAGRIIDNVASELEGWK